MLPVEKLPSGAAGDPLDLLGNIRILDLTTSIAGPYATLLLADLGASVVKIEQPGRGDDARAWGPPFLGGESLWFISVNRNKRSLTLDYAKPEGLEVLQRMVRQADVVVVNKTLAVQCKLGIDEAALRQLNPGLIHVSVTGFGLEGARSNLPCYDLIAEGYSGVMDLTGELSQRPQKVGTPAADLLAGADAALAVLAALLDRARTGRGHSIDVSLVESMTRFMAPRIVPYLGSGELPRRSGGRDSVIAIYQVFEAADGPLTIGLGNDAIWKRFWEALGQPEVGRDPRYASNSLRRAARAEIVARIQAIIAGQPRSHWLQLFEQARIPAGPINRVDEVAEDPELVRRGLFYSVMQDDTRVPQVGLGIRVDGNAHTFRTPPPRLGQDSAAVLREWLSLDEADIARLKQSNTI
ncbi:MAG: CaiB/BaiF CoA transferase family protein [Pseudomonadota bacterium]